VSAHVHIYIYQGKSELVERCLSAIYSYVQLVVRSAVTGPVSFRVLCASTPKYHAIDKHDAPPSHFKLTLCQLALF